MNMMHKINELEKPGGPQGNFHALFGRSPTFYGHFRADVVTSEWSTRISSSVVHQDKLVPMMNIKHLAILFGVCFEESFATISQAYLLH